jgi:hypothetical protein
MMLDSKEEEKFKRLRKMCHELKVPTPPEIMIGLKVHDHNGILTFDDKQRGHSWTRNFYNEMFHFIAGGAYTTNTWGAGYINHQYQTGGTPDAQNGFGNPVLNCMGIIGNSTGGIIVGTGNTAFSADGYSLATKIVHGNGANQLAYSAQAAFASSYNAGTFIWTSTTYRIFNNNSGGSIVVAEVGLASQYAIYQMHERSVLAPTVTVVNGAQLTVTYEISMDFTAIDGV